MTMTTKLEGSHRPALAGILYEYDLLYNRDIARRNNIAILRRAPGGPWEVFYYMPCEWSADEPEIEKRITEARERVALHRWTARKELLDQEHPDHERVTRKLENCDHPLDCAVHDFRPSACNCFLSEEVAREARPVPENPDHERIATTAMPIRDGVCCEHTSDCAVHNEPAYPAGPCNCDLTGDAPKPITEDYAPERIDEDDTPQRMTGPARAISDPYPEPLAELERPGRTMPKSAPWFHPTLVKKGGPR
jgi:hypothetical protein